MDRWMEGFHVLYFCTSKGLIGQPETMTMRWCALMAQDETRIQVRPSPNHESNPDPLVGSSARYHWARSPGAWWLKEEVVGIILYESLISIKHAWRPKNHYNYTTIVLIKLWSKMAFCCNIWQPFWNTVTPGTVEVIKN